MPSEPYIALAIREFRRLKQLADGAIAQVSDVSLFTALREEDNSMAIIIKHLMGNLISRWRDFLTSDGEKGRDRDSEFIVTADDTRDRLLQRWEEGWQILFEALSPLSTSDLERTVTIRGEALTVLQAINRQLTHYAYHVGQLVFLAKHFAGERWVSLSIPKGESGRFNENPKRYL